jgi:hypothetical protein
MMRFAKMGILFVGLAATLASVASAQPMGSISGSWVGFWQNSNGSRDRDNLDVREYPDGRISGVWGKGYRIAGERVAPGRYYFEAESEGSLYRANARLAEGGQRLLIHYTVDYWKRGRPQRYEGWSDLTRAEWLPY